MSLLHQGIHISSMHLSTLFPCHGQHTQSITLPSHVILHQSPLCDTLSSSILLDKTSLVLLAYMLVHHPNHLTNHHESVTKATKAYGLTMQLAKYAHTPSIMPLPMAPQVGSLHSPPLELLMSSSTWPHQLIQ
jgi:hypothetical protein